MKVNFYEPGLSIMLKLHWRRTLVLYYFYSAVKNRQFVG